MFRVVSALLVAALASAPAMADTKLCQTSINGATRDLSFDPDDGVLAQNRSMTERAWALFGSDTCPGYVTLRALTPKLTDAQRTPFCLVYDERSETFTGFSEGPRDAFAVCTESHTFCERVNDSADAALEVAGLSSDPTLGESAEAAAKGVTTIRETAAGATILTGSGTFIAGALGNAGTAAMAALTAPAAMAAAAVSVVAVGGAVYVCR